MPLPPPPPNKMPATTRILDEHMYRQAKIWCLQQTYIYMNGSHDTCVYRFTCRCCRLLPIGIFSHELRRMSFTQFHLPRQQPIQPYSTQWKHSLAINSIAHLICRRHNVTSNIGRKLCWTLECMNSRHTNKNRPNQVYYCLRLFAVNFAFIDFRLRMCIPFNRSQKGKVLYIAPNRLSAIKITQLPNAVYVLISISLANHITMNEAVAPLKEHFYCVTPHSSGAVCVCVYNLRPVK